MQGSCIAQWVTERLLFRSNITFCKYLKKDRESCVENRRRPIDLDSIQYLEAKPQDLCDKKKKKRNLFKSDVVSANYPLMTSNNRVQETRGRSQKCTFLWSSAQQQQVGAYTKINEVQHKPSKKACKVFSSALFHNIDLILQKN